MVSSPTDSHRDSQILLLAREVFFRPHSRKTHYCNLLGFRRAFSLIICFMLRFACFPISSFLPQTRDSYLNCLLYNRTRNLGEITTVFSLFRRCYEGWVTIFISSWILVDTDMVLISGFRLGAFARDRSGHGLAWQMLLPNCQFLNNNSNALSCQFSHLQLILVHLYLYLRSEGTIYLSKLLQKCTSEVWTNASIICTKGFFWTKAISRIQPKNLLLSSQRNGKQNVHGI